MKRLLIIFALLWGTSAAFSQSIGPSPITHHEVDNSVDTALLDQLLQAKRPQIVFEAGDVVLVQVYGLSDYKAQQRISEDGTILLPLIGSIHIAGLTLSETSDVIAKRLRDEQFILDPDVVVSAEARPSAVVTVSGQVAKPGVFPALGSLTILDYLSEAGAFAQDATPGNIPLASTTVTLIRPGLPHPVLIPLGPSPKESSYGKIPAFPGDKIVVGKVGMVYAVGAFRAQGAFPLKQNTPTTVMQLAALAGGIGYEADLDDAHVVRTQGDKRVVLPVRVAKIIRGKEADISLQPDDILFVPTNRLKAAIKGGGSGIIVSLATAFLVTR